MLYRNTLTVLAATALALPSAAQAPERTRSIVEKKDQKIDRPAKKRSREYDRGAARKLAHVEAKEAPVGTWQITVKDDPWHAPARRRTLRLPRPVADLRVGDVDGDREADLVAMVEGSSWGTIEVYLDVLNNPSTQPTSVIGALGGGSANYADGSLNLVWNGTKDLLVIGDSGYDGAAGNDLGLLLVIDEAGQLQWGFQGAFPGARFATAVATWDGSSPSRAQVAATTPGWQGANGLAGRADVFWLSTGQGRIAVEGPRGAQLGDRAVFVGDDRIGIGNSHADDVNVGQVDNGFLMWLDMIAQTAPATFGQPGDALCTNLVRWDDDPMGNPRLAVTTRNEFRVLPWASTTPDVQWWPLSPTAEFVPGEGIHLRPGVNTPQRWADYTTMDVGTSGTEYRNGWLMEDSPFAADLMRLNTGNPDVVNFLFRNGPPGGIAITAFAWGGLGNNLAIPGIPGIVPLVPPILTDGFVTLDTMGFGLRTISWPGAPGFPPALLSFLAATVGPAGAIELLDPIVLSIEN